MNPPPPAFVVWLVRTHMIWLLALLCTFSLLLTLGLVTVLSLAWLSLSVHRLGSNLGAMCAGCY